MKLIFDTDIGNDIDDTLAMAVIHSLQNRNECELLAVTITKDNPYAAPMVAILNTFYGRPGIPIGIVKGGVTKEDGKYLANVYNTADDQGNRVFKTAVTPEMYADLPDAVTLLRKMLAAQPDGSVVMVQVGFSTNFARLLDSPGDNISPLTGKELVARKVKLLSAMAGAFVDRLKEHREYNIAMDIPSAQKMFAQWPTPVVFSGYEIGETIQHPAQSMRNEYNYIKYHPVKLGYQFYRGLENDQPAFDLTSVLYAVRPDRGYFTLSEPCDVTFDDQGRTHYQFNPNGKNRFMTVTPEQIAMVREALCQLCSEPPKGK
ncbi:MAG: nucleoside hydrolase [Planctomycetaceae bacterium]|nr:nucleoside hydrolase [Planctomycetaceae bacterium]